MRDFDQKLSALHRIKPSQIVAGPGSSEVLVAATYLRPGKKLVQPSPTCSLMSEFARNPGSETINVPLTGNYEVDFNVLLDRCDSRTALVYLCNPNNPTGTLAARKNIEPFLKKLPAGAILVVDEAYHHFVTATSIYPSLLDYPTNDNRVIVTRTFSKLYGLAGMRVGYLVASPEVACNFPPKPCALQCERYSCPRGCRRAR